MSKRRCKKKLTDLKTEAEKSKAEFTKTRDQLAIQLQAAQNQYNTLQGQYNTAVAQALNLRSEAKNYRAQAADPKNKNKSLATLAGNADNQAAMQEATSRRLEQLSVPVKAQIVTLANDLSKRTATFEKEYKNLDQEYRKLELMEKKLVAQNKVLEKPATGLNTTTTKELAKLDDLDVYVSYSIDETKASLLKAARK